jgi:EAL domain-containing protein (putative c-di-GMP-specific phosphodiesterase class I)
MSIIKELISNGNIRTRFQPVFSLRNCSLIGFEALSYAETDSETIPAGDLFRRAVEERQLLALDRECRRSAIDNFARLRFDESSMLFINIESSVIDRSTLGSGHIINQCKASGVRPENIVIEIIEANVQDESILKRFSDNYRDLGFSIAIDDVGEGYSNLNRIALLKPDIIKADRALAGGINSDYMKQKIVSSLANLSRNIGALFLMEGIETEEEAVSAFCLGADMVQGYHFAKPGDLAADAVAGSFPILEKISGKARELSVQKEIRQTEYVRGCFELMGEAAGCLGSMETGSFNECLETAVQSLPQCECAYVLDKNGLQVSDTVLSERFNGKRSAAIFRPARKGTDHSMKEYFYYASVHRREYATEFYISLATGKRCITLTFPFASTMPDKEFFLCADFSVQE